MTVFQNEGDGENTEHLQSMDVHDVKTALVKDAELDEVCLDLMIVLSVELGCILRGIVIVYAAGELGVIDELLFV